MFTAKCSEPQVGISNGMDERGKAIARPLAGWTYKDIAAEGMTTAKRIFVMIRYCITR